MRGLPIAVMACALWSACGDLVVVTRSEAGVPTGAVGVWENVTPPGMDLTYDGTGYGVGDVIVDPARPSDLYAFVDFGGVWRSTDYALTWSRVSTGRNGAMFATGRMPGGATDHDRTRDPTTPPILYAASAYSTVQGLYRSTNGGVDWDPVVLPAGVNEPYPQSAATIDIDPYDPMHLLVGYLGAGVSESTDGSASWRPLIGSETALGGVPHPFFVDTGVAESTARTWLVIAQWGTNADGVHLTTDRGATWTQVATFEHPPGCAQLFNAGAGVVYLGGIGAGVEGIYRSDDAGAHWTRLWSVGASAIVGTASTLYASAGWAAPPPIDPMLVHAPRSADTTWSPQSISGLSNGARRFAVTSDGAHTLLVSGNFNAGIWRYVEP